MENQNSFAAENPALMGTLADERATAREQLTAAWQLHVDRVREQLENGWQEQIDHIFDERFAEIANRLQLHFGEAVAAQTREELEKQLHLARTSAERETTELLNQTSRRLKQADNREVWIRTVLEAASHFCARAVLFAVMGKSLKFEGGLGIGDGNSATPEIPLSDAPAFANAVESLDTVVAAGTPGELSQAAADLLGDTSSKRIYLFPLLFRQTAVGVLYAEPGEDQAIDVGALELITSLAANSIAETEVVTVQPKREDLITISGLDLSKAADHAPATPAPPKNDQEVHWRAQRFARTQVAHLLLYKVQQVKTGRAKSDLYGTLRGEIDAGRDAFRQQFFTSCASMVDYYHAELVHTLANRNAALLGGEYPGPLS